MLAQAQRHESVGFVVDVMPPRGRQPGPGKIIGGPIFAFYAEHKKIAAKTMLKSENSMGGKYGSWGSRKCSFIGVFDTDRWIAYLGLDRLEYQAFEKSCRSYRQGADPAVRIEVLDKILTNLGRPDLFALWYGGQPFRGEACEEELLLPS